MMWCIRESNEHWGSGLAKPHQFKILDLTPICSETHEDEKARAMSYIAFSHLTGGQMSGEWAVEHIGGSGKIAIIQGAPGVTNDLRVGGFMEIFDKNPDIEVVMGPHTDFDRT